MTTKEIPQINIPNRTRLLLFIFLIIGWVFYDNILGMLIFWVVWPILAFYITKHIQYRFMLK